MTAPNMASITALEKSLQKCSLNNRSTTAGAGVGRSRTSDAPENLTEADPALELNSNVALPYQWEQCLDLETGEVYYINWVDGTKAKEDPRRNLVRCNGQGYYSEEEEEDNSYDSEGSSSVVSPSSSRDEEEDVHYNEEGDHILVVAGCKSCMMYFMLPKRVKECPRCNGLILHFDRLENGSL